MVHGKVYGASPCQAESKRKMREVDHQEQAQFRLGRGFRTSFWSDQILLKRILIVCVVFPRDGQVRKAATSTLWASNAFLAVRGQVVRGEVCLC